MRLDENDMHNRDGHHRVYDLAAGQLTLRTRHDPADDLFLIAERINPKRAFLFVSTILGRHIPVDPVMHRQALHTLSARISPVLLDGPVMVMGFAETAIGIGAGVFDCLRTAYPDRKMGYLPTTRFATSEKDIWFAIEESHSHAVTHMILQPEPDVFVQGSAATLVLVDDETTTGKTFAELALALKAQDVTFGRVVLVTLTDWSGGRAQEKVRGCFPDATVHAVSLQQGEWRWSPAPTAPVVSLPAACDPETPRWIPSGSQMFCAPRTGLSTQRPELGGPELLTQLELGGLRPFHGTERVLIIGAGEHVWQPMLVAEACAARGLYTRFITTTRSPVQAGSTIRHKIAFPDHYGEGFPMFMHNVVPEAWDRIVLFTETDLAGIPAALVAHVTGADVVDGQGRPHVLDGHLAKTTQPLNT